MKFITAIALTALFGYALPLFSFMPWWSFAIGSAAVAALIHQRTWKAFLSGFLGLFLLWTIHALLIDSANDSILSTRVANVLSLGGNHILLILLGGFVAGLVSGFAAMTGSLLRSTLIAPVVHVNKAEEAREDSLV